MTQSVAPTSLLETDSALRSAAPLPPAAVRAREAGVTWDKEEVLFSACQEDSTIELDAFGSLEGKRVVCITAGGGRVLNLLLARPREILAVDLNPAQNALLELKVEAMRRHDHDAYLRFLGVRPSEGRIATYQKLRKGLSADTRGFFDARLETLRQGVLFQGNLERFFQRISLLLRFAKPKTVDGLFAYDDLSEQRRAMVKLETWLWRSVAQNLTRRWVLRAFSGDPGFYRYVPSHMAIHRVIYDRVHRYFWNYLARDNPLLQLVFFGRYRNEDAMPPYLHAATFERVKSALADVRIERFTGPMDEALATVAPRSVDAFSLSDISSYLDDAAHDELFEAVFTRARRGARVSSRSNLAHRPLAYEHARRLARDPILERSGSIRDHSCVHEFVIGEIIK
jgi:S-adenosylmethionine-diacylglycerol 3-amino-3-carboxypropyl transferase